MEEKMTAKSLLLDGKTIQFHPTGTSMYPLFVTENDYAIVAPVLSDEKIKRGHVYVYQDRDILVIHRACKVLGDEIYFVGDHQTKVEGPYSQDVIYGKLVAFVRKGKEYSISNVGYRLLSFLWLLVRPFRTKLIYIGHIFKTKKL